MANNVFELDRYLVRRKVFKILGAGFHVYSGDRIVGYSQQKAFKLKEDIRLYTGEDMAEELLVIRARQVIDFAACYDVVDPKEGIKVGAARRKGFRSMLRDSWEILDADDAPLGMLEEDSAGMALLRRFVNILPQTFHLDAAGGRVVLKQHFNPFVYKLEVSIDKNCGLDRRLVLATAVLIAAIEGRQN